MRRVSETVEWQRSMASEMLERGVYGWRYEGAIRTMIRQAKYHGNRRAIEWIVRHSKGVLTHAIDMAQPDLIIPIPSARRRLLARGFNLPSLIAHSIGEAAPPVAAVVIRVKDTPPLAGLRKTERHRELEHAFRVIPQSIQSKRVLLVDDIVTTGATVQGIERICYQAGALRVDVMGLAITPMQGSHQMDRHWGWASATGLNP